MTSIYAWALMSNHAHILLSSEVQGLAKFMRRFLTGYAVSYNVRHRRHGHVFQNRYQSIVCEADSYFIELVRYIHLNPLRVKLVADLKELERYPYCGHGVTLRAVKNEWQDCDSVLAQLGTREGDARGAYRRFVEEGVALGRRPELVGGGRVRSAGGWSEVKSQRRRGEPGLSDARILGSGDFVERIMREAEARTQRQLAAKRRSTTVERLIAEACKKHKVSITELRSGSRRGKIPEVRAEIARQLGERLRSNHSRGSPAGRGINICHFEEPGTKLFQLVNNVPTSPLHQSTTSPKSSHPCRGMKFTLHRRDRSDQEKVRVPFSSPRSQSPPLPLRRREDER